MPLLPRAALFPPRFAAVADPGALPAPAAPERTLALALAASFACHVLVIAALQWSGGWWSGELAAGAPGRADTAPMVVDLAAAGADDRMTLRVRPASAVGVPGGTGTASASGPSSGPGRKAAAASPPATLVGVVTVEQTDDIGFVDPALARRLAAEFRTPPTERPRLESALAVAYPDAGLAERRQMQVGVLVVVDENGDIVATKKSLDDTLFAPRIDAALQGAKLAPATRNGRPVRHWTVLLFHFEVEGPPKFP